MKFEIKIEDMNLEQLRTVVGVLQDEPTVAIEVEQPVAVEPVPVEEVAPAKPKRTRKKAEPVEAVEPTGTLGGVDELPTFVTSDKPEDAIELAPVVTCTGEVEPVVAPMILTPEAAFAQAVEPVEPIPAVVEPIAFEPVVEPVAVDNATRFTSCMTELQQGLMNGKYKADKLQSLIAEVNAKCGTSYVNIIDVKEDTNALIALSGLIGLS